MEREKIARASGGSVMLYLLRIAISAAVVATCVLLIVLWVRSHQTCDAYLANRGRSLIAGAVSYDGSVYVFSRAAGHISGRRRLAMPIAEVSFLNGAFVADHPTFRVATNGVFIVASHLLMVAWLAAIGALCWVPLSKKFNLRNMMLATALIAVLLGAAVHAIK